MSISRKEAKNINQFLGVEVRPKQADLAFVFGTRHPEPAYISADLFKRGLVDYVVLTGGRNRVTGVNEATEHLRILMREEIPRDRIIIENESTNTVENVAFALEKIAGTVDLRSIKSVIVVTKWYHCRRGIMTLKHYLPKGIRYFTKCYEPNGIRRSNWYLTEKSAKAVLKEWQCIPKYLSQGHISEIQVRSSAIL